VIDRVYRLAVGASQLSFQAIQQRHDGREQALAERRQALLAQLAEERRVAAAAEAARQLAAQRAAECAPFLKEASETPEAFEASLLGVSDEQLMHRLRSRLEGVSPHLLNRALRGRYLEALQSYPELLDIHRALRANQARALLFQNSTPSAPPVGDGVATPPR
jgi:hypothetical protein